MRAVRRVLESLVSKLVNEQVRWFTDNQYVCRVIMCSNKKLILQAEALAIFSISVTDHIRIEPEWINQANNQLADYLSHIVDYDDWYLDSSIFRYLEQMWDHTQLTVLQVVITPSYCGSTRGSRIQERKQSML